MLEKFRHEFSCKGVGWSTVCSGLWERNEHNTL